jgi:hypothetical protein
MSIADKIVNGGKFIANNKAAIGGALALGGAVIAGQAFFRTPEVTKNSKYKGNLMFPNDLIDPSANRNSYMAIQFVEYQRRSIFNQPFLSALGGVRLPIPNQLAETFNVTYDQAGSADPAVGAGIEAGLQGRNGIGSSGNAFNSIAAAAVGAIGGKAVQTASAIGTQAGLDVPQALQLGGLAQNPFLTVLFKSPAFRKHTFSWKLMPNNEQESNTAREIIQTFRSNMLPALAPNAGGTLLTYPNMAIINLYPDETLLYKFKPCVVEALTVNYAAGGQPSFFKGTNAPTHIELSITLLEIEYWLKEDIENNALRTKGAFF